MRPIKTASPEVGKFYRYDHPRMYPDILNDMFIRKDDLGPGDVVDLPRLTTVDDELINWPDRHGSDVPLLLVFGSLTCPVTESGAHGLVALHRKFGHQIRFVLVNVREAHPGSRVPQPKTIEQKVQNARELRSRHRIPFEVAVDDIDGTLHRLFGGRPNSVYVISASGKILFRAQWANETAAIERALGEIAAGKPVSNPSVTRTMPAMMKMVGHMRPVLSTAGKGATLDTWKVAPPLGMMMVLSGLFPFFPRKYRGAPAMLLFMALVAVGIGYGVR